MNRLVIIVLVIFSINLTGCSRAEYSMYDDANSGSGGLGSPVAICDAFDADNIVSPISGLKGSIFFLRDADPRQTTSTDLINVGTRVNADLFMNSVFVPTRTFSTGFATDDGSAIENENGDLLVEWFAMSLNSKILLAPGETAGEYQLAVISDDGSTLSVQNSAGNFEKIVENENTHPTKMACAAKTISMDKDSRIPMNLSYFQGPRQHIALIVMWRKVVNSDAANLRDVECGASGNDHFFVEGTATKAAVPKTPYQNLLSRGWKPLSTQNFELQSGTNLCNAPI